MSVNGWTYDPVQQAWTARVGRSRWLVVPGDLDDPPSCTPQAVLDVLDHEKTIAVIMADYGVDRGRALQILADTLQAEIEDGDDDGWRKWALEHIERERPDKCTCEHRGEPWREHDWRCPIFREGRMGDFQWYKVGHIDLDDDAK